MKNSVKCAGMAASALLWLACPVFAADSTDKTSNPAAPPANGLEHQLIAQLSGEWWQWAASIPPACNPVLDGAGTNAGVGQSGPVWFVAGTFGGPATRSFSVPGNRALFIPLYNIPWVTLPTDPDWDKPYTDPATGTKYKTGEDYVRALLKSVGDTAMASCEVDGRKVEVVRCQSPVFSLWLPSGNVIGYDAGVYGACAAEGLYVLLPPLAAGRHTIHYKSKVTYFDPPFELDVKVDLTVVPVKTK